MKSHFLSPTLVRLSLALGALAIPIAAHADPAIQETPVESPPPWDHKLYVSFSPLHLPSIVELTAELRLTDRTSVVGILGAGKITVDESDGGELDVWAYETGAQYVTYPIGGFDHGLQLGAEALYIELSTAGDGDGNRLVDLGQGLAVGPFVGYKLATDLGFTVNAQVGVQYLAVRAEDDEGEEYGSAVIPLVNLNAGWSF